VGDRRRVDPPPVQHDLEVQVRPRCPPGPAHAANDVRLSKFLASRDGHRGQVRVAGLDPLPVVHDDGQSVAALVAGRNDTSCTRCRHVASVGRCEIHARVKALQTVKRVGPVAKAS